MVFLLSIIFPQAIGIFKLTDLCVRNAFVSRHMLSYVSVKNLLLGLLASGEAYVECLLWTQTNRRLVASVIGFGTVS